MALAAVDELLKPGTYTTAEIEELLGAPLPTLFEGDASARLVLDAFGEFKLHDRAAHVYAEAARVPQFASVCREGGLTDAAKIAALGELMDASHASCRDLYQCSLPELDLVVQLAKRHGAIGARLTGAGWGGGVRYPLSGRPRRREVSGKGTWAQSKSEEMLECRAYYRVFCL